MESGSTRRLGVLFVHGVGTAAHSDTLIDFGRSFFGWVARWNAAQGIEPEYGKAELNFRPYDAGSDHPIPYAELHLPRAADRPDPIIWVGAEAWWDSSVRATPFTSMVGWSVRYLLKLTAYLWLSVADRLGRLVPGGASVHDGAYWYRVVDGLTLLGHFIGYALLGPLGYVLLVPIAIAAQIPYDPIRNFAAVALARVFLQYNASQLRLYYEDEIQAANMRRRVAEGVEWLTRPTSERGGGCESVVIVAHSGGVWVAHGMLTDDTFVSARRQVRKFISLGAGLNKIWEIAPASVERLVKPVTGEIYWIDFWGSYDPVPTGWLQPPRVGPADWRSILSPLLDRRPWHCIYEPTAAVARRHGLQKRVDPTPPFKPASPNRLARSDCGEHDHRARYWPDSIRVVNRMDALTDHGGYFTNDEEVLRRVAAEIDAELYSDSVFWPGTAVVESTIRSRRTRVSALATARIVGLVVGVLAGYLWGTTVAEYLAGIGLVASLLSAAREVLHGLASLPVVGHPLASWWDWLVVFLLWAAGAAIASLAGLVPYEVFRAVWEGLDQTARDAALRRTR